MKYVYKYTTLFTVYCLWQKPSLFFKGVNFVLVAHQMLGGYPRRERCRKAVTVMLKMKKYLPWGKI